MSKLTYRKRIALEHLAGGSSVVETAQVAGVTRKTVHSWLNDQDFKRSLEERSKRLASLVSARITGLADKALTALELALEDRYASRSVKVRASQVALQHYRYSREFEEFEERLSKLEAEVYEE